MAVSECEPIDRLDEIIEQQPDIEVLPSVDIDTPEDISKLRIPDSKQLQRVRIIRKPRDSYGTRNEEAAESGYRKTMAYSLAEYVTESIYPGVREDSELRDWFMERAFAGIKDVERLSRGDTGGKPITDEERASIYFRESALRNRRPLPLVALDKLIAAFNEEFPDEEVDTTIRSMAISALYLVHMPKNQLE